MKTKHTKRPYLWKLKTITEKEHHKRLTKTITEQADMIDNLRNQRNELLGACKDFVEILEANKLGLKSQEYFRAKQAIKKNGG